MEGTNNLPPGRGPGRPASGKPWEPSLRDLEIYAGLAEGRTTRDVAEQYGIDHSRVVRIGQKIDKWLAPQWMDRIRELKARQTESLMHVFREAMGAWRDSKRDAVSSTDRTSEKHGTETSVTTKGQCGNPSFLSEARAALADIRKIWGADAPVDPGDTQSDRVSGRPREEVIREQIARLRAALEPHDN